MDKINAAIIGCGAIFNNHAEAIADIPFASLTAIADNVEERAQRGAEKFGCTYYTDYRRMLEDKSIDAVHICTPHYLHDVMAQEAMEAGKHVLLEKPVAMHVDDAARLVKAAERTGKYLGVCLQNRYNPTSIKVKEILDSGTVGKVIGVKGIVTWYRSESYYLESGWRGTFATEGGGVLINQAIHTLDLMQWFAGEIEAIKGHVDTRKLKNVIEVEDTADATVFFKNGATGIFYATNCHTDNSPVEIEIHCENGSLRILDGELTLRQNGKKECLITDQAVDGQKAYWGQSHQRLIEAFYNSIIHRDHHYVNAEAGTISLKMIEAIYKSSQSGEIIEFEGISI